MLTRDEAFNLAQQQSPTLEEALIKIERHARAGEYLAEFKLLSKDVIKELEKLGFTVCRVNFNISVISWGGIVCK